MPKLFGADINDKVYGFLKTSLAPFDNFHIANRWLQEFSGVKDFFENGNDFSSLQSCFLDENNDTTSDRTEYGDFQTSTTLSIAVTEHLRSNLADPQVIVEPTCGKGAFVIAALRSFRNIEKIFSIEIYKPYVWQAKLNVLEIAIDHPSNHRPEINIFHANVFEFDFAEIMSACRSKEVLILGNPPWVTNAQLGRLGSTNLPEKSNFKKLKGLDAITGRGNFDIGETVTSTMLEAFESMNGQLAFLVKNSVVKNIVFDQKDRNYKISDLKKYHIDSKKEFNVSVEASLFTCKLNSPGASVCEDYDFYNPQNPNNSFGWVNEKFVADIGQYKNFSHIDGSCAFEWRQGVKHDCSAVMELERVNGHFTSATKSEFGLEEDLVYGILKSADLKTLVITTARKYTIITQKKVGQETLYINERYPKTYQYLSENKSRLDDRKSSIYKNKPEFSIFGIGDYSFKPYKVSISGLYKKLNFKLILPQDGKPLMLDDTCYFIGFDSLTFAVFTLVLLNSPISKAFLQSITFSDAKRTFTKDVLMRIDLLRLSQEVKEDEVLYEVNILKAGYGFDIKIESWKEYLNVLGGLTGEQ